MSRAIEKINQLYWQWLCKNHPGEAISALYMAYIERLEFAEMAKALAEDLDLKICRLPS